MRYRLTRIATMLAAFFTVSAFNITMPFNSSDQLETLSPEQEVMVGITHVTLGDNEEANDIFWNNTYQVIDSLPFHQGYLGHKLRKQLFGNEAWTMTVWENEDALNGFVRGQTHGNAIEQGLGAVAKARFVRLSIKRSAVPLSWSEAEMLMNKQGRTLYGTP